VILLDHNCRKSYLVFVDFPKGVTKKILSLHSAPAGSTSTLSVPSRGSTDVER